MTGFVGKIITPILNAVGGASMVNGLGFSLRHGSPEIEKSTFFDVGGLINLIIEGYSAVA